MKPPLRALIVEDCEEDALLAVRHLGASGFQVESHRVDSGPAMEEALRGSRWDIVLTDNSMPGFSAREAIALSRRVDIEVPVVVLSGTMTEDAAVDAMRAGADDFVSKDNPARLAAVVERALRESARRGALRRAENQLRETSARLAIVDRLLPAAIFTCTADRIGQVTWISDSVERITGFPPSAFLEDPGFWISRVHPEDLARFLEAFCRPLVPSRSSAEVRWKHADGTWRWYFDHATLVHDDEGRPKEVLGLLVDITERRSLEAQLQQAQKIEALGLLAGGVAHDFNNMLMVIQGFTELLAMSLPAESRHRQHTQEVLKAVQRASGLTRQLLAFSRRQIVQAHPLQLNGVVGDTGKMLQRLLTAGVEMRQVLAPDLGLVKADSGQVEQVLLNLAVNARDAMAGRGVLTLTTENVPPGDPRRPRSVPDGDWVVLSLADTGCGMDDATLARIFEPFFTTKEKGRGTGLGLATVHGIVSQSGGFIAVESAPGRGTTFRVFLPRLRGVAETAAPVAAGAARGGAETLLLVDDDPHVREVTLEMLRGLGYTVLEATDGPEALEILSRRGPEIRLLVSDFVMPGMFGDELVIRARERLPDLRCLFVSGDTGVRDGRGRRLPERTILLPKPYTREELARRVREALGSA